MLRARDRVVLVGMMGAGKTRTGSALAARLGWRLHDSDAELEARTQATGAVIGAEQGVAALHALEARILLETLATEGPMAQGPTVVCAAASTVDDERCRAALADATLVVWLDAPTDVLAQRVPSGATDGRRRRGRRPRHTRHGSDASRPSPTSASTPPLPRTSSWRGSATSWHGGGEPVRVGGHPAPRRRSARS